MGKPKDVKKIAISSQKDDDTYNKKSSGRKHQEMGGSRLIQEKFYRGDDDAS